MAIPNFQMVTLPLLELASDQKEHGFREAISYLADVFQLSQEERKSLLPSGTSYRFDNKVGWARIYLVKTGLLESTRRGYFIITQRGLEALKQKPIKIDSSFLRQYPGYDEFVRPSKKKQVEAPIDRPTVAEEQTPEESLEYGYQQIRQNLAQELLSRVKDTSFSFFEKLVVELLVNMGYGGSLKDAGEVIGGSGDAGIDGVIKEDRLGLDTIYIQAKRWEGASIGRPELQKFVGALKGQQANKGVFITTSKFSNDAKDYISKIDSKIVLIDGEQLAEFMIDYSIGVTTIVSYDVKRVDSDYFYEE